MSIAEQTLKHQIDRLDLDIRGACERKNELEAEINAMQRMRNRMHEEQSRLLDTRIEASRRTKSAPEGRTKP